MMKETDVTEFMGNYPGKRIQIGLTDSDVGYITKIREDQDGNLEFYWDFWGAGWYKYQDLPEYARSLASSVIRALKK